jgi:phosphoribosylformylglycinamidine synthase I
MDGRHEELGLRKSARPLDRVEDDRSRDDPSAEPVLRQRRCASGTDQLHVDIRIGPKRELAEAPCRGYPRPGQRACDRVAQPRQARFLLGVTLVADEEMDAEELGGDQRRDRRPGTQVANEPARGRHKEDERERRDLHEPKLLPRSSRPWVKLVVMTRIAILRYPGTWSERDFAHALSLIEGVETEIQWHEEADLRGFDAAIVPGGFSYGDYLRAGAIAKLSPGTKELRRFASEGGAILGSCNGFQILCEAGLLPGALIRNADLQYRSDWVRIRVESDRTPFTAHLGGEVLRMPIGNGEGCWVADPETHARVEAAGQVVFRYVDERGVVTAAANPNGSLGNIAGVTNDTGNVVGLMPHPERCVEALLGGTDGYRMLANVVGTRHGTAPALYR